MLTRYATVMAALAGIVLSLTQTAPADEFVGPLAGWRNVKTDFGAVGDGVADDTAALQKALDDLRSEKRQYHVLYVPAGRYRITKTLELARTAHEESKDVAIIGEDPASTEILWDGVENGVMFLYSAWYSRVGRLTFDGKGKALTAIRHGPPFVTYNEFSDMAFRDVGFGIEAGMKDGIAETTVWRCAFSRCSKAGISIQNFNSLDWFIWDCRFEDCARGVTNTFGAGNFHVYRSRFFGSTQADMSIGNTCYFSLRENTSFHAQAFFAASPMSACSNLTIQGNMIVDCQDTAVRMQDLGPLLLLDNTFDGPRNPAVEVNSQAGFVCVGNTFTGGDAVQGNERGLSFDNTVADYNTLQVVVAEPAGPLPKQERPVIELPPTSTTADIQHAIEKACALQGQRPVIHLPAGTYAIQETLAIPAGCDVQLIGDGCDTVLRWAAQERGPVLRLAGPSRATLRDFFIDAGKTTDGIVIDHCDQPGGGIFMDQANLTSAQQVGLLVEGLENANVALYNINHAGNKMGVKVVGGPGAKAGKETSGRVVIFSGSSSNNELSYDVEDGGRLVVRDIWYESGEFPRFMHCRGSGSFTLHGAMVAVARKEGVPALEFDDFHGDLTFLTSIIHSGGQSVPIVVEGRGADLNLLLLGVQMGIGEGYLVNNSPEAHVALLESMQYTPGGGGRPVPDVGAADSDFLRRMLAPTRSTKAEPLTTVPAGLTDVRLYRIGVSNAQIGIHLVP
jgi:hypothetical protein